MLGLAALGLLSDGCTQTKQLEEMHDSTAEMNHTTQKMNDRMGNLRDVTSGLCRGSSQALPLQARQMTLNQMDRAVAPEDKINWAVTYVQGFDFQAWPLCESSPSEIDHMLDDAVLEFFQVIQRYDSGHRIPNPFVAAGASGADAQDLAFNMLSTALGFVNRQQLDNRDKNASAPVYSFLSIIKESLSAGVKLDKGELRLSDLKQYQIDVLANKGIAVKLLQARQSMSLAIVLSFAKKVTVSSVGNLVQMAKDRYLSRWVGGTHKWRFRIDDWNQAQLKNYGKFVNDAVEARAILKEIGVKPELDPSLAALIGGMTASTSQPKAGVMFQARSGFVSSLGKIQRDLQAKAERGQSVARK